MSPLDRRHRLVVRSLHHSDGQSQLLITVRHSLPTKCPEISPRSPNVPYSSHAVGPGYFFTGVRPDPEVVAGREDNDTVFPDVSLGGVH